MRIAKKITIQLEGMSCANCALGIKKHLDAKEFKNVNVNFSTGEASCSNENDKSKEDLQNIIKELGYTIISNPKSKSSRLEKYFYFTLFFTIPLFSHMFVGKDSLLNRPLTQLILCIPVYLVGVYYFGKSALSSIRTRMPNMDVLIFIGSTSAFIYSIYGWIIFGNNEEAHNYLFFETTAMIITLVLLGNLLENKSVKKTTTAISDLSKIKQVIAKRKRNKIIEEVNFEDIKVDDILIINTGDKIPTDGIIISGSCIIDESMITGESLTISKSKDHKVIGGTIVIEGSIIIKATKVGDNTLLSQIIELVKNAQNKKPDIQRMGDKVSAVFVPIVLVIAILTFFFSEYLINYFNIKAIISDPLLRAISVLVISCPCAMGLATPTAVMVGIGRAAKNGILIKGGKTLEKLASIKSIIFDKTGTLTTGKFIVSNFNVIEGEKETIQNIIYNIEQHSSHPIAKSLCNAFKNSYTELMLSDINEHRGISISAKIGTNIYTIGSSKIYQKETENDLYVLKNSTLIATIDISDKVKNNTSKIIKSLHESNYSTSILSGDKKKKCELVGKELGIKDIFSEQLPKDKIIKVEEIENELPTAMVGDGINDAPALAKATIGISLADATQVAVQTSDIVLLNNKSLEQLPRVLALGKHTLLTIKQNLFWAFSYNLIAIPIAVCGLLSPMWGALFMAFSDIVVVGNSIRLHYKNIS